MVGKRVGVCQDALVGGLHVLGLERRLADQQCVEDHARGPDVHLEGVSRLPLQYLWRDVVRRAADGLAALVGVREVRGQAEVPHLDAHVRVDKQVPQLQIPVDDQVAVQVL